MNLADFGWDDRLAKAYQPLVADGLIPARVVRQKGPISFVWAEDGELEAEVSGRLKHAANAPPARELSPTISEPRPNSPAPRNPEKQVGTPGIECCKEPPGNAKNKCVE